LTRRNTVRVLVGDNGHPRKNLFAWGDLSHFASGPNMATFFLVVRDMQSNTMRTSH
jgi:hypothetical protein